VIASALFSSLLAASAGLSVQVQGTSNCPSPIDVAAILPEILPMTGESHPDIAWVEAMGPELSIELRSPEGKALFSRRITSHASCADLANVVAVVIASWKMPELFLLHPGLSPLLPVPTTPVYTPAGEAPSLRPTPVPRIGTLDRDAATLIKTEPSPFPPVAPERMHAPTPTPTPAPATQARLPRTTPIPRRGALGYDFSAAIGTSRNSAGFAGTARLEAGAHWRRFGLRLTLTGDTERDESIEAGTATWQRFAVGIGPSFTLVDRILALEANAQLFAGITTVHGQGFEPNYTTNQVSPAAASGLRLGRAGGRVRPWIETGARFWFIPQAIAIQKEDPPSTRVRLPRSEACFLLGMSFFFAK
jgi:hypothetical protein